MIHCETCTLRLGKIPSRANEGGYILPPNISPEERERLEKRIYEVLQEAGKEDHPYSCPRAAKLETRLAEHFYTKHEVDELLGNCLEQALAHVDELRGQVFTKQEIEGHYESHDKEDDGWRKALLDKLEPYFNFDDLRKRFL